MLTTRNRTQCHPRQFLPSRSGERREVLEVLEGIAKLLGLSRRMDHIMEALDSLERKVDILMAETTINRVTVDPRILEGLR